ncbi:hypothetical protein [Nocardioides sp. SYSU D00065]|uniref:hypothetical protein n=1 Tax=Nocardioides sp. SYSU D00065 TaxID=2817378 RepID=UPI001B31F388|nr:hypothetical protein [Nocardioides sp. SYSU D00065]
MDEVWKALGTGVVTLLVGFVLLQHQLGGRRGRRRRELLEEVQLLEQLELRADPAHADELERIRARVTVLLREFEEHPDAVSSEGRGGSYILAVLAIGVALGLQAFGMLPNPGTWEMFLIGGGVGALGVAIDEARIAVARRSMFRHLVKLELEQRAKRKRASGRSKK